MLYKITPYTLFKRLWGDRKVYQYNKNIEDPEFQIYLKNIYDFYEKTQRKGVGSFVTDLSYKIVEQVDFSKKCILELGPGKIEHAKYAKSKPDQYYLADIRLQFLEQSEEILSTAGYKNIHKLVIDGVTIPVADNFFDVVVTFHQLEHVDDLESFLLEIKRVLKSGGILVGGVPTEGGLAWGLGRYFTTRKFIHKNYGVNYDKIICWEHRNFVDKIQKLLLKNFSIRKQLYSPFYVPNNDLNLTYSFVLEKK